MKQKVRGQDYRLSAGGSTRGSTGGSTKGSTRGGFASGEGFAFGEQILDFLINLKFAIG